MYILDKNIIFGLWESQNEFFKVVLHLSFAMAMVQVHNFLWKFAKQIKDVKICILPAIQ